MNYSNTLNIKPGRAICYSGFRQGQSPDTGVFPDYAQIKEDLHLLSPHWQYLRLYDCDKQTEMVLDIVEKEGLDFKIMLGAYIGAEMNNFGCPWGTVYSEEELSRNKKANLLKIEKLIKLANRYSDIVFSVSAGNEATVDWTDHYVPVEKVIEYVRKIKAGTDKPVTFCENYVPWKHKLKQLAEELDFISIHTYPVWEYKRIHEAMEYTRQNYNSVAEIYPDKLVVITEAGWATNSSGRGIEKNNVSEENQQVYVNDLLNWSAEEGILSFVFEAFDEPWKGSPDPLEPEKHWGLYTVDRKPKRIFEKAIEY